MSPPRRNSSKAFTLVELLVVIVIIIAIAALSLSTTRRMLQSARATKDIANLRQTGLALSQLVAGSGYFPIGIEQNSITWADLVVRDQLGEDDSKTTQIPMLWSPLWVQEIPANLRRQAVSHFAVNPSIMNEAVEDPSGDIVPKLKLRSSQLHRPSEQMLLCGAIAKSANGEYHETHPVLWDMAGLIGGPPADGSPPELDPADAEVPIRFPAGSGKNETYGSMPDFFRYGGGRGYFFFVDGHVEALAPADHREKYWAVSY
ncbi:MAG: prepilin-type N-terminal cleavage/methylation domain-containing protein [Luteolibacter sp.]